MSQASFNGAFNFDPSNSPRKPGKKKLRKRQEMMGRAIESLESRQMLSVSGFQPAVHYATAAGPKAVATGDFNHDGKTDLVTVNQTANSVSVLLGTGSGTFGAAINSTTGAGTGPRAVVVGDFNNDGKLDVAVADQSNGTVAVLLGKNDGTFNAPVSYAVGAQPVAIAAGDFNGDGRVDLVVADFGDVRVLTGNANGTFNAAVTRTAGTSPNGLALADFNHDGNLDIAVSNGGGNVSILKGNGDATFVAAVNVAAGANIKGVAAGDFTGDGYADLAVLNGTAGTVSILTNDGNGAFGSLAAFTVGTSPVSVTAADFNNDGKTDLAVANSGGNNVSVLSGNGDGTFGTAVNKAAGTTPAAVTAGDFNADGSPDLAIANGAGNNVSVLLDKHITAAGQAQVTVAGTALTGVTVATFTDSEAGTVNGDYTATIDWGDGTSPTTGAISSSGGVFSVAGSHTYQSFGVYDVTATIHDTLGTTATATTSAEVDDAAITATGTTITTTEGSGWTGTVGSFTSANPFASASDFLVAIDYGDGRSGMGVVVSDGGGAFHVTSSHTWRHAGPHTLSLDVQDSGGQESVDTTAVTVNDAAIHGSAGTPVFTEGTSATQTVATFTDDNAYGAVSEFTAVIHWGDGSQSNGTVTSSGGVYSVAGAHSYDHAGNKSLTVNVTSSSGSTTSASPTATVHNATLTATGRAVTATEGTGTGSVVVASFTDANAAATAGDFSASVNWGDGSSADVGSIAWNSGTSKFDVTAPDHTYDHAGSKTITVTITGLGAGTATATPTATVNDAAIAVTASTVTATEGTSTGTILLGTFTDANPAAVAGDFHASVNWGDGPAVDTNTTITWNAGNSDFEVRGSHAYAHAGLATMTLTVTGAGGSATTDHTDNTIANAAITATATAVSATEGSSFNGKVASFTSASSLAHGTSYAGDFTATIDWGDGTATSTGTVAWNAVTSKFDVSGIHTYHHNGSDTVTVTVNGLASGTSTDTATATIADAALHSTGTDVTATEGVSTGSVLLATFTDDNPYGQLGDYSASVNWGDFSGTDHNTTITFNNVTNKYEVYGSHTYAQASYNEGAVTIIDGGGSTTDARLTSSPAYAVVAATPGSISATEGHSFTGVVAHFTDANAQATAGEFTASIVWNTGGTPTTGTIAWNSGTSQFDVTGTHTYNHAGAKAVSVTITGNYADLTSTTFNTTVANDTLAVTTNAIVGAHEGVAIDPYVVAHFTDANAAASAADFTTVIDWGDGTPTTTNASVVAHVGGGFDVVAGHTYAHAGPTTVQVTVNGAGGGSQSGSHTSTILNRTLTATSHDFTVVEGAATGSVVVASFTDANASAVAGDFTASIDWGDSSSTDTGTIAWNNVTNKFDVTAPTHSYDHAGTKNLTVTVNGLGGGTATATPNASVTNAAIAVSAQAVSATEGTATGSTVVATFTDANAAASAADFTGTINWGDGTVTHNATIQANGGSFNVLGSHTYTDAGSYTTTVTVDGNGGGSQHDSAAVSVANAVLTATGGVFTSTEGVAFTGKLIGTFTDANAAATAGKFTVSIDWGDGSAADTTTGVITSNGSGFDVRGDHSYAHSGSHTVVFTITGAAGGTAVGTHAVNVGNAPLHSTGVASSYVEGVSQTGPVVAHFTDDNALASASDFTANVNFGDGTTLAGTVVANVDGGFDVQAPAHSYDHAGTKTMTIVVHGNGGGSTQTDSTASIANALITTTAQTVTATEGTSTGSVLVATFTDANAAASAADFTASVVWNVGATADTATTIVWNAGNSDFEVYATHNYNHAGSKTMTVTVLGAGGGTSHDSKTFTVANGVLTASGVTATPVEGASFTGAVAHFTDANGAATIGDFTATIDWGDGSSSTSAVIVGGASGGFDVTGTHTYATLGTYAPSVSIHGNGGGTATATGTANVADAPLSSTGTTLTAIEGTTATGVTVAHFTDANPNGVLGSYTATITWGDGGATSVGTVTSDGVGGYNVTGGHLYTTAGSYNVSVLIGDSGTSTTTATGTTTVNHGTINAAAVAVTATEGTAIAGTTTLATFTDTNQSANAGGFTATVDWGDGTSTTSGTVVSDGNGGFIVQGGHTYAHAGGKTISVAIAGFGGTATVTPAATVHNAAITVTAKVNTAMAGNSFSGVVGSFTDANASAAAGDFTATVIWGDGNTTTNAPIAWNAVTSKFDVTASHTYHVPGTFTTTLTINGAGGGSGTNDGLEVVQDGNISPSAATLHATEGTAFSGAVASFTDGNPEIAAGSLTATINWGDGSAPEAGTLVSLGGGAFNITGAHVWTVASSRTVTITIGDVYGGSASVSSTAIVADAALTSTGVNVTAVEGATLTSTKVMHFTDANPYSVAGDFTATINWGDGSAAGTGTVVANVNGGYDVFGTHTYAHAGTRTLSVTAGDAGGSSTTSTASATIANATLGITAGNVSGVEGTPIIASVATFTDANAGAAATDFTATINWGDGTTPTVGAISDNGAGGFDVLGSHTYRHAGSKTITVTVNGNGGGTISQTVTATVANATLAATGLTASATEGTGTGTVTLTHFTDANANASAGDFTASVLWADGTTSEAATVVANVNGGFDVTAGHTYAHAGDKSPVVTVTGLGGGTANATATVHVVNAALAGTGSTISTTEGQAITGSTVVAHFTDANALASAGDFNATVTWGDGSAAATASIVANVNGGFDVLAGHTYAHAGNKSFTVAVAGNGGGTLSLTGTAHVVNDILVGTAASVTGTEGTALAGTTVFAHFTDANALASAGDFTATVNFGDGHSAPGSVVANVNGGFDVVDAHTYNDGGDFSATVNVAGNGNGTAQAVSSVHVNNAALTSSGLTLTTTEGVSTGAVTLAHFADANALAVAGDFTAAVLWGDGSASEAASIVANVNGGFDVTAAHSYAHSGDKSPVVTVTGLGGGSTTATATVHVQNAALAGTGSTVSSTEGQAIAGSTVVAHFTDANALASAGDFTATVTWSNGSSATLASVVANVNGGFDVLAGHTYNHAGTKSFTVAVNGNGGGTLSLTGTAHVANDVLIGTAASVTGTEGTALAGTTVFAHFTDANALASAGDFTATVDFGDGQNAAGTVVANVNGGFDVVDAHTYNDGGDFSATVHVSGNGAGTTQATSSVHVNNAALTASGKTVTTTEGVNTGTVTLAHFADANALAVAGDFTASVLWGDGSASEAATVVTNVGGGFDVTASHTFAHSGDKAPVVTVLGSGGGTVQAVATLHVLNAALAGTGSTVSGTEGQAISGSTVVAHFTDANALASAGDFTATVTWGDGSAGTAASVVANVNGGFDVVAGHTYAHAGDKSFTVAVAGNGGGTLSLSGTAHVANDVLTATTQSVTGVEGTALAGSTVFAHFTDANALASAGDFTATVDFGDGHSGAASVVANLAGGFDVVAAHTYGDAGDYTATVHVAGNGSGTAQTTSTVHVDNAGLAILGNEVDAVEGTAFSGVTIAHFTDVNAAASVGSFTVSVDWGDGTDPQNASLVANPNGGFDVVAGHTYAHAGPETFTLTLHGAGGATTTSVGTALVANAAMASAGKSLTAVEGTALADSTVVAHFTDANASAVADDFLAVIHWGDNNSTAGTVVANANGGFDVLGGHSYDHAGSRTVTVDIDGNGGGATTATTSVAIANAAMAATGTSVTATEGSPATSVVLAHFTDANPAATAADFTATIAWGDTSTGTATIVANPEGGFDVTGTHTYTHAGNVTATVAISGYGNGTASATTTVHVANAALSVTGKTLTSVEGASFSGAVASFTDANAGAAAADFTASIAWGDGSSSVGTVSALQTGGFAVSGSHTYAHLGNQVPTVTITGAGGATASGNATMSVTDASFAVTAANVSGTEGSALSNVTVGSITDVNTLGSAANFTASINWGDGTPATVGTLVQTGPGTYDVKASHTFAHAGGKTVTLTVTSEGSTVHAATSTATVANAALTATGVTIATTAGRTFTGKLAHFTDANVAATASEFTASINWADGTTTTGTVVAATAGGFDVTGSHGWRSGGTKAVSVTVTGAGGGTATAIASATVATVTPTLTGTSLRGSRGVSLTATVATVATTNTLAVAGDFTATIAWGDGTTTAGTVSAKTGGGFNVVGTHSFAATGTFSGKVTLYTADGLRLVAGVTTTVVKPVGHSVGGGQPVVSAAHATDHTRHVRHVAHVNHTVVAAKHDTQG